MTDETTTDKPLANLAETERNLDPPTHEPVVESEHTPATARLRAFEDEHFGPDAVRIGGEIERGSGSPFAALNDKERAHYAALEKLVVAEQKRSDSAAAVAQAEADHAAAMAAVEQAEADAAE
jgi:hypothetical protein